MEKVITKAAKMQLLHFYQGKMCCLRKLQISGSNQTEASQPGLQGHAPKEETRSHSMCEKI